MYGNPLNIQDPSEDWNKPVNPPKPVERKDVFPGAKKHCFLLYNVLSPEECEHYIKETEKLGYRGLKSYTKSYRDNDRLIVEDQDLAKKIFERCKDVLPLELAKGKDEELGWSGDWQAIGLNERFRFCRYEPGGHFNPHYDAAFTRNASETSMLTFMIYLNGGFAGGATNFLSTTPNEKSLGISTLNGNSITAKVVPEPGMALVFQHHMYHEGETIRDGTKYIMRSDVMYQRQ